MARKDPHAIALGRKGGSANTPAQLAARRKNALKGGRKLAYRVQPIGHFFRLEHRRGDDWYGVVELGPRHLLHLAKWLREQKPKMAIRTIQKGGEIDLMFRTSKE